MLRKLLPLVVLVMLVGPPSGRADQVYLTEEEAPKAVFPDGERFERRRIDSTPKLRGQIREQLERTKPSVWEDEYTIFTAYQDGERLGEAVIIEEIGKHRPITFVVGVDEEGEVAGVAVMVYREPYGGEVRSRRFLSQYRGKSGEARLVPGRDVRNITGATLSAHAIGRGVKKAMAVVNALSAPGSVFAERHASGPDPD